MVAPLRIEFLYGCTFETAYAKLIIAYSVFEDKDKIELQFINNQGVLVASSYGQWAGASPRS